VDDIAARFTAMQINTSSTAISREARRLTKDAARLAHDAESGSTPLSGEATRLAENTVAAAHLDGTRQTATIWAPTIHTPSDGRL
jgi:hypothetical protein